MPDFSTKNHGMQSWKKLKDVLRHINTQGINSFTFGLGVPKDDDTFPEILETKLNKRMIHKDITIWNKPQVNYDIVIPGYSLSFSGL